MVPGMSGLRDPLAGPGRRAAHRGGPVPEAPEVERDVRLAPAVVARRGATRGPRHGRRPRDGGCPLRGRGGGRRRPPPDAHRAQGRRARRRSPSASRGCCPTSATTSPSSSRRSTRCAGALPAGASRIVRPPFRAPHHSASRTGILGGGTGRVRPGEVSKAHLGVLFLDEFPLFPTDVVEALREPLECRRDLHLARRGGRDLPGPHDVRLRLQPVPLRRVSPRARETTDCTCREVKRREYRRKISGPIADRIDITRFVEPSRRDGGRRLPVRAARAERGRSGRG